jgi:hypothetical protein
MSLILTAAGWSGITAAEIEKEEPVIAEPAPPPDEPMIEKRLEMRPEQIERILAEIRQTDPQKADELIQLREKDPEAFKAEIRNVTRERFVNRMRENRAGAGKGQLPRGGEWPTPVAQHLPQGTPRALRDMPGPEMFRGRIQERAEEYMKWLKENYPDEATKLERLKDENPEQYIRAMGISGKKFRQIFEASKNNPQLASVLKEQLTLKEKRAELLRQIRATTDEKQKKELTAELEKLVGQQFDLIVRRKQLACDDLTKKLTELQKEVDQKKAEIEKWKSEEFKNEKVKQRVNKLLSETEEFEWD